MSPLLTRLIELTQQGYRIEFEAENAFGVSLVVSLRKDVDELRFKNTFVLSEMCLRQSVVEGDELFFMYLEECHQKMERAIADNVHPPRHEETGNR